MKRSEIMSWKTDQGRALLTIDGSGKIEVVPSLVTAEELAELGAAITDALIYLNEREAELAGLEQQRRGYIVADSTYRVRRVKGKPK